MIQTSADIYGEIDPVVSIPILATSFRRICSAGVNHEPLIIVSVHILVDLSLMLVTEHQYARSGM